MRRSTGQKRNLDVTKLQACVKAQNDDVVKASMKEGETLGITATPTMFINGAGSGWRASHRSEIRAILDCALKQPGASFAAHPASAGAFSASVCANMSFVARSTISLRVREDSLKSRSAFVAVWLLFSAVLTDCDSTGCASKQVQAMPRPRWMAARSIAPTWRSTTRTRLPDREQPPVGEQATILRLNILRELIENEILMRRAEKLGLLATDEEVDRKLNEIKSPYTQEQFDAG